VEPDAERAQIARQRGVEVVTGYLTRDMLDAVGQFDVVLFADVLEHLPNPSELLRLACSALHKEGVVVLSVPNVAHWSVRWSLLRGRFDYEQYGIMDATHLRWFTTDSLGRWLRNNGLVVEAIAHSAGTTLPVYYSALPWRRLPTAWRFALIRRLARLWPNLFGCQHIIRASRAIP
jgi:SAM-dependent methyltransferase